MNNEHLCNLLDARLWCSSRSSFGCILIPFQTGQPHKELSSLVGGKVFLVNGQWPHRHAFAGARSTRSTLKEKEFVVDHLSF